MLILSATNSPKSKKNKPDTATTLRMVVQFFLEYAHIVGCYALERQSEAGSALRYQDWGRANFAEFFFHALW